jgi:hypothetical protein
MVEPSYRVFLNGVQIGTTALEFGDPPMGVVFGKVSFSIEASPYRLFLDYCAAHDVPLNSADPDDEFIDTQMVPELCVLRGDGIEISGVGCSVTGTKSEGYQITVLGIPYPFYAEEFPHHCSAYDARFKT